MLETLEVKSAQVGLCETCLVTPVCMQNDSEHVGFCKGFKLGNLRSY